MPGQPRSRPPGTFRAAPLGQARLQVLGAWGLAVWGRPCCLRAHSAAGRAREVTARTRALEVTSHGGEWHPEETGGRVPGGAWADSTVRGLADRVTLGRALEGEKGQLLEGELGQHGGGHTAGTEALGGDEPGTLVAQKGGQGVWGKGDGGGDRPPRAPGPVNPGTSPSGHAGSRGGESPHSGQEGASGWVGRVLGRGRQAPAVLTRSPGPAKPDGPSPAWLLPHRPGLRHPVGAPQNEEQGGGPVTGAHLLPNLQTQVASCDRLPRASGGDADEGVPCLAIPFWFCPREICPFEPPSPPVCVTHFPHGR